MIAWLDNEATGFAAGKGSANSISFMAASLVTLEARSLSIIWVERLCSFANPSDKPSCKQCKEAARMFRAMHDERPICLQVKVILATMMPMESFAWKASLTDNITVSGRFQNNEGETTKADLHNPLLFKTTKDDKRAQSKLDTVDVLFS